MTTTYLGQSNREIAIDLNGNTSTPKTKAGKPAVLRYHAVKLNGEMVFRLFSQNQIAAVKKTGQWFSANDRDWEYRTTLGGGSTPELVSPSELKEILSYE